MLDGILGLDSHDDVENKGDNTVPDEAGVPADDGPSNELRGPEASDD